MKKFKVHMQLPRGTHRDLKAIIYLALTQADAEALAKQESPSWSIRYTEEWK
jgi:hypothetical protein